MIHDPLDRSASIALPARETSALPSVLEPLESRSAFPRVLSFSIETSAPAFASGSGSGRREVFEWRRSSGGEVEALGGRHSGWKLVRVSAETATTSTSTTSAATSTSATTSTAAAATTLTVTPTTSKKARKQSRSHGHAHGESSDGMAIVAVWVGASAFFASSRVLRFRFLGAGADGGLGRRFAVMAVATALAIWHRERRVRHRGLSITASF